MERDITDTQEIACRQPLLRWAGSKRQMVPLLSGIWGHGFKRYVEPFCGSAAAFFQMSPDRAALNDLNPELMNVYLQVRDRPDAVAKYLGQLRPNKKTYYGVRKNYGGYRSLSRKAAAFIFLNRLCFNGLYRTNKAGEFNVPYSGRRTGQLPTPSYINALSEKLSAVSLSCLDFQPFVEKNVRQGDFVFLDPPYYVERRRVFRQYTSVSFESEDILRLKLALETIDKKGAKFLLSFAKTKDAAASFDVWTTRTKRVRRNIAGFADHRRFAYELLVTNLPGKSLD